MKYDLRDLIDIPKLQELTEELYSASGIPSALISMDGEILTGAGWQPICTDFHRKHTDIEKECIESDTKIRKQLDQGGQFVIYECPRGLVDASSPIVINGRHIANVFAGQVFLSPKNMEKEEFFRHQAHKFGFDETEYLEAYKKIPVFSEEKFRSALLFLSKLAIFIANLGLARLNEMKAYSDLQSSELKFRRLLESTNSIPWELDFANNKLDYIGPQIVDMLGYPIEYWNTENALVNIIVEKDKEEVINKYQSCLEKGNDFEIECRVRSKDGKILWLRDNISIISGKDGIEKLVGFIINITEKKEAELILQKEKIIQITELEEAEKSRLQLLSILEDQKETEAALKESEERYRVLVENLNDVVYTVNIDTTISYISPVIESILLYKPEEMIGKSYLQFVHPDDRENIKIVFKDILNNKLYPSRHKFITKFGEEKWAQVSSRPVYFRDKLTGVQGILTDITAQKESEDRIQLLADMLDTAPNSITVHNFTGNFLYANCKTYEMHGYDKDEFMKLNLRDLDVPESAELITSRIKTIKETGEASFEVAHFRKDRTKIPMQIYVKIVNWLGEHAMLSIGTDITERKKAEEEINSQKNLLSAIFESSPYIIALVDEDAKIVAMNNEVIKFSGREKESLLNELGGVVFNCIHSLKGEGCGKNAECSDCPVRNSVNHSFKSGESLLNVEGRMSFFEKDIIKNFDLLISTSVVNQNNMNFVLLTIVDITERKKVEEALRQSEEKFRSLYENATVGIYRVDTAGRFLMANTALLVLLGFSEAGSIKDEGMRLSKFVYPEDREEFSRIIIAEGVIYDYESTWHKIDGSIIFVRESAWTVRDHDNNILYCEGIIEDITEYKKAKEDLKQSEEKYRSIFNDSPIAIEYFDADGNLIDINSAALNLFGVAEFTGIVNKFNFFNSPQVSSEIKEKCRSGIPVRYEKKVDFLSVKKDKLYPTKKNNSVFLDTIVTPIITEGENKPSAFVAQIQDITERKIAEKTIREQERKYRIVADNTYDWEYWLDINDNFIYCSPSCETVTGYGQEQFLADSKLMTRIIYPDDSAIYNNHHLNIESKHKACLAELEFRIIKKTGEIIWIGHACRSIFDEKGNPLGLRGSNRDITKRKFAEMAMKESEERFRKAFMTSPDSININRLADGLYLEINDGFTNITGFTKEDVKGKTSVDINIWADLNDREKLVKGLREKGKVTNLEAGFRMKNGKIINALMSASIIELNGEKCILSITRDIEEIKQAQEALRKSEEQFRLLAVNSSDVIWTMDMNGNYLYVSPSVEKLRGFTPEEVIEQGIEKTLSPASLDVMRSKMKEAETVIKEGGIVPPQTFSLELQCKNGSTVWTEITISIIYDDSGNFRSILGVTRDITERKKAEDALWEKEHFIQTILDTTPSFIYIYDLIEKKLTYTNSELSGHFGYKLGDVEVDVPFIINSLHPDDLPMIMKKRERLASAENHEVLEMEFRVKHGSGKWHWLQSREVLFAKTHDGAIWQILGTAEDITEKKEAAEALLKSQMRFKLLSDASPLALYETDANGDCIYVNERWCELSGLTPEEAKGKGWVNAIYHEDREYIKKLWYDHAKDQRPWKYEYRFCTDDGKISWLLGSAVAIRNENGKITGYIGANADITDRKLAEESLKALHERYNLAVKSASLGVWDLDLVNNHLVWDDGMYQLYGISKEKFGGAYEAWASAVHPDDIKRSDLEVQQAIKGEKEFNTEFRVIRPNGEIRYLRALSFVTRDQQGAPLRMVGINYDITARKLAEQALIKAKEFNENLIKTANVIIVGLDIEGKIQIFNDTAELITGYKKSDLDGKNWFEVLVPLNKYPEVWKEFNRLLEGELPRQFENPILTKAGVEKIISWQNSEIKEGNNVVGTLSFGIDITEKKAIEEELHETYQFSNQVINSAQEGIIVYDTKLRYLVWNPFMEELTGIKSEAVIGKKPYEAFPFLKNHKMVANLRKVLKGETIGPIDFQFDFIETGKKGWTSDTSAPLRNVKGEIIGVIATVRDITERKKTEMELEAHRNHLEELVDQRTEELERTNSKLIDEIEKEKNIETMLRYSLDREKELNELKSRFISTTSHEFRTPLTSILSSTELIQRYSKKWTEEKLNEHLERVKDSVDYLTNLLDDVLTISKSESGRIVFDPQMVDLYQLSIDIINEMNCIKDKTHKFSFDYLVQKKKFYLDSKLIRFIISNLLSNAFKYSPKEGNVFFEISSAQNGIVFQVSDNGIGIPEEDRKHLFEPFHRAKNTMEIQGTGLGLSIVKRAVDLHGGTIKYNSTVGTGTTFTIEIPRKENES